MNKIFCSFFIGLMFLNSCSSTEVNQPTASSRVDLKREKITLVDVRIPEQYEKSPVKGAINIPLKEIENNIDFFKKQKKVVLFCNSGRQATEAYEILKRKGVNMKNIHNLMTWENVLRLQSE